MTENANVIDVSSDDFEERVVQRSTEIPVLVDFWAPWCAPCRFLGPMLEKIADEMEGAFVLAKVNSDESPELVGRYRVQGIPNVQLFKDGAPVNQFVGALPEAQVRSFLRSHLPSAADEFVAEGKRRREAGDLEGARQALTQALAEDGACFAAHLDLARLDLAKGDLDAVLGHVESIPATAEEYDAGQSLLQVESLVREAIEIGGVEDCRGRLEDDGADVEARFALGGHELARGQTREALEHYLEAARADRHWRNDAARKAMVAVFGLVGERDPLSEEFRDKLRAIYY